MSNPTSTPKLKVLVFAASLRAASLNHKLAALAVRVAEQHGATVDLAVMRDFEVPLYDGDIEATQGIPAGAEQLRRRLLESDAFIIASPEYNGSMPGTIKNLIDWTSRFRPQPFDGRHGLLLSASPSLAGGNRGLWALRMPLEHLGTRVFPDMFSLAMAHKAFAGDDSRRPGVAGALRQDRPGVSLARRGRETLPVHQEGLGRVPWRTSRGRWGSRRRRRGVARIPAPPLRVECGAVGGQNRPPSDTWSPPALAPMPGWKRCTLSR